MSDPTPSDTSPLFAGLLSGGDVSSTDPADPSQFTDIVNALTAAFSQAYSILLPAADIATALGVTLPTYDASLFADNLDNPLDAIGLPIAANTGLLTLAAGIGLMVIEQTAQSISDDLSGVF
jgi:hypothetical protein